MLPRHSIDPTRLYSTASPHLFTQHLSQTLSPASPDAPHTLLVQATSLVHTPPETISALIQSNLPSLLNANSEGTSQHSAGQLSLSRTLKVSTTASGRAVSFTFNIQGILQNPHKTIFEFNTSAPASPSFEITLATDTHDCTLMTMTATIYHAPTTVMRLPSSLQLSRSSTGRQRTSSDDAAPTNILPHTHAVAILNDLSSVVVNCHKRYARYAEIDLLNANSLFNSIPTAPSLTTKENDMVDRHTHMTATVADWRRMKGTVNEPVEYFQSMGEAAWGKATTTVDASSKTVFSYLYVLRRTR